MLNASDVSGLNARIWVREQGEHLCKCCPQCVTYTDTRTLRYTKGLAMLRGEDVLAVQARLIELGFDPGKADSVYGPMTAAAVTTFQASRKIEADGIVGTITRRELG